MIKSVCTVLSETFYGNYERFQSQIKLIEETINPTPMFVKQQEIEFVKQTFGVCEMETEEELVGLRNNIVKHYGDLLSVERDICNQEQRITTRFDNLTTLLSCLTFCVDTRLMELGFIY